MVLVISVSLLRRFGHTRRFAGVKSYFDEVRTFWMILLIDVIDGSGRFVNDRDGSTMNYFRRRRAANE